MRALYLDIDGVLNIFSPSYSTHTIALREFHGDTYLPKMEQHLVRRLEYIIEQGNVNVIYITSSWGVTEAKRELSRLKFKYLDKISTESLHDVTKSRALIIDKHLKEHLEITSFVVLEDEPVGWEAVPEVYSHTVYVNYREGITNQDCTIATGILEKS